MPIESLSGATRSKIRSTQILTSLPQVILELVQNSLDAGAHQIDVGVSCGEWECWVRDDGLGMSKDGMATLAKGSEAGRYGSSKAYEPASLNEVSTFGFRGEALSSAADLSCLEISSRTSRSRESWSVILKGGDCLYNGPSVRWRRESPGTVVCIRDAFYNLPVRRLSHPNSVKTLELIRRDLEQVALVFPDVSFSLEDTRKAQTEGWGKGRIMTVPKTGMTIATFRHLYGRALVQHVDEINLAAGDMKLNGFISLDGAHSKAFQFLYVNRHPLALGDLHRTIDGEFAASTFTKHAYEEEGETSVPRSAARRSPRKTEKKPVYVLNLTIPPRDLDNCLEPAKTAVQFKDNQAASMLSSAVQSFLVRHGFLTERQSGKARSRDDGLQSPNKKRKSEPLENQRDQKPDIQRSASTSAACNRPASVPASSNNHVYVCHDECSPDHMAETEIIWTDPSTGEAFIVDTRTGNSYSRASKAQRDQRDAGNENGDHISGRPQGRRTLNDQRWLKILKDPCCDSYKVDEERANMPEWIRKALQANKVYALTEPSIPALTMSSSFSSHIEQHSSSHQDCRSHHAGANGDFLSRQLLSVTSNIQGGKAHLGRFSKGQLYKARVIKQVDRKFIACLIDASKEDRPPYNRDSGTGEDNSMSRVLVLIDQHAADERVRVERFLKELCLGFLQHHQGRGVKTREVEPPIPVLLTRHEILGLAESDDFRRAFERWGIIFEGLDDILTNHSDTDLFQIPNGDSGEDESYLQVHVRLVPEVVAQKLLMGDELRDLVKGYLGRLAVEGSPSIRQDPDTSADGGGFWWLKALRWCPRELLELVNSKACRGAIMFNDSLTLEQCEGLVQRLSETAFPFQCAHGRPSLVPLADVSDIGVSRRRADVDWGKVEFTIS